MKQWVWRVSLVFLVPALCFAGEIPPDEARDLYYAGWKMPSQLSPDRLETLISKTATAIHGVGFQYLGVDEDWFHGHLLLENLGTRQSPRYFPRAILYHTQEEAYSAHWRKEKEPKYDYLNVATRNWIQWLSDDPYADGLPIENARAYVDERQLNPKQFLTEFATPDEKTHYTIHGKKMDPRKLGFVVAAELQFEFYNVKCGEKIGDGYPHYAAKGPVEITLPNGQVQCLKLTTMNPLYENDPPKPVSLARFSP